MTSPRALAQSSSPTPMLWPSESPTTATRSSLPVGCGALDGGESALPPPPPLPTIGSSSTLGGACGDPAEDVCTGPRRAGIVGIGPPRGVSTGATVTGGGGGAASTDGPRSATCALTAVAGVIVSRATAA